MKSSTLKELLIGILVLGILGQLVCFIFLKQHLYHAIGLWTGVLVAAGMAIHMQISIEDGLDIAWEDGAKHMKKAYLTRTAIACGVMAVVLYFKWGNPLTLLFGVMTLKLAVYLQPFVHRILERRRR